MPIETVPRGPLRTEIAGTPVRELVERFEQRRLLKRCFVAARRGNEERQDALVAAFVGSQARRTAIQAEIANEGGAAAGGEFRVVAYHDDDGNGSLDRASDVVLGEVVTQDLSAGERRRVAIPIAGTVAFRDDLVHVVADADGEVAETSESNNDWHTGRQCGFRPATAAFSPVLE